MNEAFQNHLLEFSQEESLERRDDIEKTIWEEFGQERSILVVDMAGFTKISQRHGIIYYLSMVRRMQITSRPIIENYSGKVVRYEADNCFATFKAPLDAVRAAISMNMAFDAANILTPDDLDIEISCGIDHGEVLIIDDRDFYGNAVNRASKLGEDQANSGEILITESAMKLVPAEANIKHQDIKIEMSGITINASSISYKQASNL
jgi:adenylate cyclase